MIMQLYMYIDSNGEEHEEILVIKCNGFNIDLNDIRSIYNNNLLQDQVCLKSVVFMIFNFNQLINFMIYWISVMKNVEVCSFTCTY